MRKSGLERRAVRAFERQLAYQQAKAAKIKGREPEMMAIMEQRSTQVREMLSAIRPIAADARVLEVGCGSHGLIFFFGAGERVGVDPLADFYRHLFPAWQDRARTVAVRGEELPFEDESFDLVLCDNVVDHAENPRRIVEEMVRVLAPGGMFYFTVNVHHPVYHFAASIHAAWRAAGVPFEIAPFADHTVHLTPAAGRALLNRLPIRLEQENDPVAEAKGKKTVKIRHAGDRLKRFFFKNARYRVVAIKNGGATVSGH